MGKPIFYHKLSTGRAQVPRDLTVLTSLSGRELHLPAKELSTVKTLYNDTVFFAVRIVIPKVSLYSDFVRKTHQRSKLYNDIAYL